MRTEVAQHNATLVFSMNSDLRKCCPILDASGVLDYDSLALSSPEVT